VQPPVRRQTTPHSASAAARWKALVAVIVIALVVSTAIALWMARSRPKPKTIDSLEVGDTLSASAEFLSVDQAHREMSFAQQSEQKNKPAIDAVNLVPRPARGRAGLSINFGVGRSSANAYPLKYANFRIFAIFK